MRTKTHGIYGAALLLVLWAIAVLSFSVLWVADLVSIELDSGSADAKRLAARQMALTGLALGMHPQVTREDVALLNQDLADGGTKDLSAEAAAEEGASKTTSYLAYTAAE